MVVVADVIQEERADDTSLVGERDDQERLIAEEVHRPLVGPRIRARVQDDDRLTRADGLLGQTLFAERQEPPLPLSGKVGIDAVNRAGDEKIVGSVEQPQTAPVGARQARRLLGDPVQHFVEIQRRTGRVGNLK